VHKPESARLRRHLSAVVNFAKFREEKLVAYAELQGRIEALVEQQHAAEAGRAAREAELAELQAARAAEAAVRFVIVWGEGGCLVLAGFLRCCGGSGWSVHSNVGCSSYVPLTNLILKQYHHPKTTPTQPKQTP
jgi:hypothetical protein